MNHPTVVFRRSAVEAVGGYQQVPAAEDYWLCVRLLAAGAEVRNVPETLVRYRVSGGAYARRGGLTALRGDLVVQAQLRASGFLSAAQWLRNVAVRVLYRFLPTWVRARWYRRMVGRRP